MNYVKGLRQYTVALLVVVMMLTQYGTSYVHSGSFWDRTACC